MDLLVGAVVMVLVLVLQGLLMVRIVFDHYKNLWFSLLMKLPKGHNTVVKALACLTGSQSLNLGMTKDFFGVPTLLSTPPAGTLSLSMAQINPGNR